MGNRKNVRARWYGTSEKIRNMQRRPFIGTPQFSFESLFISPFTEERHFDERNNPDYEPLPKKNLSPSGVWVLDDYIRHLYTQKRKICDFCAQYNMTGEDLDGLVFALTGLSNQQFRSRWMTETADLWLRYTDLEIQEIARRSGIGTRVNFYYLYEREFDCSPSDRRFHLRQEGDLGRFR